MIERPVFASKQAEIEWIFKNKDLILLEKKNALKHSDVLTITKSLNSENINKDEATDINNDVLKAELVINTTNIIDSHMDCHIDGIWTKSLKELGLLYLLQEHEMEFEAIIADSVKDGLTASAKQIEWSKLGLNYQGKTQALIFNTSISKGRNKFMFDQYQKGYVYNHSVCMRYVKLYLCVDSTEADYTQEKEAWDKYYPLVVNKEVADQRGYFWAVTEAKVIEGSAVVKGSNHATPTLSIKNNGAVDDTPKNNEPSNDTQKTRRRI